MKLLVAFSVLLFSTTIYGMGTRTKSGKRPRHLMPYPVPPANPGPVPVPAPPMAYRHPAVLTKKNPPPPPMGRNDVRDVPDNSQYNPPPSYIPPGAPASRRKAPPPRFPAVAAVPNMPPTRTRTLGLLRRPVFYEPYVPPMPSMPPMPPTIYPTSTQGWVSYTDPPEVKKEEEEEGRR